MLLDIIRGIKEVAIESFNKALKGKEKINNIYIWWGIIPYLMCYFIIQPLINFSQIYFIDFILALVPVLYFIFHIFLINKNKPKKIKLTKAEKKKIKEDRFKSLVRKFFLKEPWTKWNSVLVFGAIDLFVITHYLAYIL